MRKHGIWRTRRLNLRHGIQCAGFRVLQDLLPHPAPQPIGGPLCARPPAQALYERAEIDRSLLDRLEEDSESLVDSLSYSGGMQPRPGSNLAGTFFRIESLEPDFL